MSAGSTMLAAFGRVEHHRISVADEGPGFPAAFGPAAILGLGLRIVSSLAGAEQGTPIAVVRAVGKIVVRAPVSAH